MTVAQFYIFFNLKRFLTVKRYKSKQGTTNIEMFVNV